MSPMIHLTVRVRNDLGEMPLGKIASQAGHALGAFVLGCFDFEKKDWKTPAARSCFSNPDLAESLPTAVKMEYGPEAELEGADVMIVDQGHTVFKGVPTKTVGLFINQNTKLVMNFGDNPYTPSETTVRMTAIINKTAVRKDKQAAIFNIMAAYGLHTIHVLNQYRAGELSPAQVDDLLAWTTGSFAKITLVGNSETIAASTAIQAEHPVQSVAYGDDIRVMGPAAKAHMDVYTSSFKML